MSLQTIKQRFAIIGRSPKLDFALQTAVDVANTELSVLITGQSGVGKEVFSKIIHSLSARKHNNFIAINCGAIPEGTINSELFGHEKGAFTGATSDRKGYFETVNSGTIFLDEIGEMPLDTQAYLLRILENGEFIKVGSNTIKKTDVRVVAATNVDLIDKIRKGKFREDLYYRLNTVPISVPALRERREDIYMLFRKFAVDFAEKYRTTPIQLDERAQLVFENYAWPGNIRELRNVTERLSVLSIDKNISGEKLVEIIPDLLNRNLPTLSKQDASNGASFEEREILYKLLFDMKADMNDLKSLVFELINSNNLQVDNPTKLHQVKDSQKEPTFSQKTQHYLPPSPSVHSEVYDDDKDYQAYKDNTTADAPKWQHTADSSSRPIIIHQDDDRYHDMEVVEENLSIADMEKELIKKALDKHNGRRKEAAEELGISERTLYRKIKQYEIEEG